MLNPVSFTNWALCFGAVVYVTGCQRQKTPRAASDARSTPAISAPEPADARRRAASTIDAGFLREQVRRISADAFEGRAPGTAGDRAAREYLIQALTTLGVEPGFGASGFEQPVELVSLNTTMPAAWKFERARDAVTLKWWEQYIAGSGVHRSDVSIPATELVFAGYGIEAPEFGWDDFKGADLKGKLLLLLNNDPDWDPGLFAGTTRLYYGRWTYKYESAARRGAAGALILHTRDSAGYPFQVVQTSWGGEVFDLPAVTESPLKLKGWLTEEAAGRLAGLAGKQLGELVQAAKSQDFRPVPLGVRTSIQFNNQARKVSSANVLGVIRGSDPDLQDEYVVLTAHHDHLGIGKADAKGDRIYNGALDNGAGLAMVLAIARAIRALPRAPRRSILVLFVAAEEQGLLGSRYFVDHSSVPLSRVVANINFDAGNMWGRTRDVSQIGFGKSSVDGVVARAAAEQGRVVRPDQFPDRGFFYRSDQFNFARVGVPAVYLEVGTDFIGRPPEWGKQQILAYETQNYHQPSDELTPEWNFDGMVEEAQLGFAIALELANTDQPPTWNPGDEFEAVRKAALHAAQ